MSSLNTNTNQLHQTTTAPDEYTDSSSSSSSTSPSGTSTPRPRRSCAYGFAGCRGGRRCSAKGHPNEAAAVKMLLLSMTMMMRSELEANGIVGAPAPVQEENESEDGEERTTKGSVSAVSEKNSTEQRREVELLPTYQAAVLGGR